MLAPLSWLKDYVDIDVTPKELEEKLFSCGFEVEELIEVGKDISNVVVGLMESCEPIPDTHLSLCQVNAGEHGTFQICCGADNVRAGGKYPLALVGATVYATAKDHVTIEGVMTIKKGKLRGYESYGMLCSGTELGLNEDLYPGAGYNGLLVLPEDAKVGADVKPILGMDDWIFDIAITANRPDCQSIYGIAREVAAVLGKECREPALDYTETAVKKDFKVEVAAKDLCPRYIAHYVHDVTIGESPAWMRRRLALVGINSISNMVDITNYVLKELGQPMHAFDYAYLEGDQINVRRANEGERIVTLDEKEFMLNSSNLVICDGVKPVALAGIMGGLNSEIKDTTTEVMFESAKFARDNIRKSSRALGQSSDSSAMYAKGVYEYTTVMAMKRALHLVEELGCGKVSSTQLEVSTGNSIEPKEMKVSVKRVNGVLGIEVPEEDMLRILSALQFAPSIDGDELTLQIPAYREDMDSYPDVAEEVIRMYGYEHVIPTFMPTAKVTLGGLNLKQKTELKIKRALCAAGAYEGVHYSFFSPSDLDLLRLPEDAPERKAIKLINPINVDLSLMRTTLASEMLYAISRNQKKGILEGRIFELGNVFIPKALPLTEYPDERETLCAGVFGEKESFYTLKGLAETVADALNVSFTYEAAERTFLHPYQTAEIFCEGEVSTGNSIEPKEMKVSVKRVNGVLGIEVPEEDMLRILSALQFAPSIDGDELTLQIPAYREDMDSYPDVAEEVIRMYGYEHVIPTFMPTAKVTLGGLNLKQKTELKIKRALCAAGAYEGVHYSFFSPSDLDLLRLPEDAPERKAIKLINPINVDLSLMRTTLASEMLYAISRNQKKGILEGRIFELGNVFIPKALPLTEYPDERETLCAGVFGEKESFYTLKGLAETVADALNVSFTYEAAERTFLHPYQTAEIFCEGERVGYLGKLSYEIQDELDMRVPAYVMEIDLAALKKWYGKEQIFTPLPKFAEEKRDFAFVVDKNITCAQIENGIREACKYVTDVNLFDVYEGIQLGPDKKSMAFSVVFTPQEEELTGEMVEGFVKKILKHLEATLDIRLRA